jgi:hypothetical protein
MDAEYPDFVMNASRQPNLRTILLALLCIPLVCSALFAQHDSQIFTVAAARDSAARLGSTQISVRGHFRWGKSIIFDSGHKAVLRVKYSDEFHKKHPYHELFPAGKTRKSDLATITGRLHSEGKYIALIADDIQFDQNPQ